MIVPGCRPAGVVVQNVNTAKVGGEGLHGSFNPTAVGDVNVEKLRHSARGCNLGSDLLTLFGLDIHEAERRALIGEQLGAGPPNSRRCASD